MFLGAKGAAGGAEGPGWEANGAKEDEKWKGK